MHSRHVRYWWVWWCRRCFRHPYWWCGSTTCDKTSRDGKVMGQMFTNLERAWLIYRLRRRRRRRVNQQRRHGDGNVKHFCRWWKSILNVIYYTILSMASYTHHSKIQTCVVGVAWSPNPAVGAW
jgi:hypothetical protein